MLSTFDEKRVVIVGLARQGRAAARWLAEQGARVTVADLRAADVLHDEIAALDGLAIEYVLGPHPPALLDRTDLLCISGGVPLDAPFIKEARQRGIPLTNDAQLFIERCPVPVIGITGSAGKTTTTALVGAMCKATGAPTHIGGNIGHVLLGELDTIGADDRVVMELSSFQLELMTVSPAVAAVLNITPNHLDRHGTMSNYSAAKAHILQHQQIGDVAVLGRDNRGAAALAADAKTAIWWFSASAQTAMGAYLEGDEVILARPGEAPEVVCTRADIKLRGDHNVLNVLAACAIAGAAEVPTEAMRSAIVGFQGIEHRLETVATINGVTWVNDSIATAPERAIAALRSYDAPIILLAGGRDKKLPWQEFAALTVERVRRLICFGEAGPLILRHVSYAALRHEGGKLEAFDAVLDLEAAVQRAAAIAQPGEVVLLAPGGTSFDAYQDFAARGRHFRALVARMAAGEAGKPSA